MAVFVLLDAGPLGLLGLPDSKGPARECRAWVADLRAAGVAVRAPLVAVYEVRRELVRRGAAVQLARLDLAVERIGPVGVSRDAWRRAGEFWAHARAGGIPTAHPEALDGDAILAGVAATIGGEGDSVIVATTNVRHLGRFPGVVARAWEDIQ